MIIINKFNINRINKISINQLIRIIDKYKVNNRVDLDCNNMMANLKMIEILNHSKCPDLS